MGQVHLEYKDICSENRHIIVSDMYNREADVVLFNGDCSSLLKDIPSGSIDLVITSPPYNIGKKYEKKTSLESYLDSYEPIIHELNRAITSTGSLCWQVGNYVQKGEVFPLDIYFYEIFKRFDFKLRNRIIWSFRIFSACSYHSIAQKGFQDVTRRYYGLLKAVITSLISMRCVFPQNIRASDVQKDQIEACLRAIHSAKTLLIFGV